jgi:hypothetical protein
MNYSYSYESTLSPVGSIICLLICLAVLVIQIVAMWKMFEKAGVEGWKSIIPFYNSYCMCDIAMGNGLLFLLSFVPCVNFIFSIILAINLAKAYGKGIGFGILMIFFAPIMYMILAFSDAEYIGPQK